MLNTIMTFIFSHIPSVLFFIAIILAIWRISKKPANRHSERVINILLSHIFIAIGLGMLWGGCFHVFAPQVAASFIGWQTSPFQFEVGMGDIGTGVAACIAGFSSRGFRLAVATYYAIFAYGAAIGHVHQMLVANNFAPGNAGLIFWMDILLPTSILILLLLQKIYGHSSKEWFP